jgi:nicotinate-nucleotide adenylyltransferase
MRLGILGGTFDPPHNGHLQMAEAALTQLHLDRVLFAPAGLQPLRQKEPHTAPEHRTRMVELAIAHHPQFELSRIDLDRPGPHYTVDLLAALQRQYPATAWWFIMGEDSLADLLRWRDPAQLIMLTRLAVLRRHEHRPDWSALDTALPDLRARIDWIDHDYIDIAATEIRRRVYDGRSIDQLVPRVVMEYIVEHHLYRE